MFIITLNYQDFSSNSNKEIGKTTFSQIFERKSARLVWRDYFTFNLETNYWNSDSNFISRVFLPVNPLNKGVNNKSVDMFNIITHRKHRRIGIMEYVTEESRDIMVTGSHKFQFRKKKTRIFADLLSISQYLSLLDKKHGTKG